MTFLRVCSRARDARRSPRGREALRLLVENARIAREDRVAICQDTGSVWVCLEVGPDVVRAGRRARRRERSRRRGVHSAQPAQVARARCAVRPREHRRQHACVLRDSRDDEPGARIHIMCKGGGSDNASRVVMLTPGAGKQGIVDAVLACVREKAANACPPLVIGVGVGATFDKVAGFAKMALMRPIDQPSSRRRYRRARIRAARCRERHGHRGGGARRLHHRARRSRADGAVPYRGAAARHQHGLLGHEEGYL